MTIKLLEKAMVQFLVFSTKNTSGEKKKTSLNFGTSNVFILLERLILMQRDQSELICLVSQRTHLFVQKKKKENKIALINEAALRGSGILSIFWLREEKHTVAGNDRTRALTLFAASVAS